MLIQRIGPLDLEKLKLNDGEERTFYDMFVPDNDGKTYKGEWLKKNGKKDGVGIMFWPDGTKYEGQFRNDK